MSDKKFILITIAVMAILFIAFIAVVIGVNKKVTIINPIYAGVCDLDVVDCSVTATREEIIGVASWYDYTLASGWSSVGHYVCASRFFERGTMLEVKRLYDRNNPPEHFAKTFCKVTDYGPDPDIHPDRIIDLSSTAFSELAPLSVGLVPVVVKEVK